MKEQLISFETAKLAKEKGFNIKVLNFYDQDKSISLSTDQELFNWNNQKIRHKSLSAPTQSLLQKWLWIKHKIWIDICLWDGFFSYMVKEKVSIPEKDSGRNYYVYPRGEQGTDSDPFNALEEGLQEALNNIR